MILLQHNEVACKIIVSLSLDMSRTKPRGEGETQNIDRK